MSGEIATPTSAELLERVVVGGNLAQLSARERMSYYKVVCESVGLNPLTRPFEYITLNGKLTLYAKRDATDQLRDIHGVSIESLEREVTEGIYCVTAHARNAKGRVDTSLGAVAIDGLKGEARANAMMKAETKAKRRVTLSLCGLGLLDETEVDTIPGAMLGEPRDAEPQPNSTYDQNAKDRKHHLDLIRERAEELGWAKADGVKLWNALIGKGIGQEAAPIGKLMEMADEMKRLIAEKTQREEQKAAPLIATEPVQDTVPF